MRAPPSASWFSRLTPPWRSMRFSRSPEMPEKSKLTDLPVSFADIEAARHRIAGHVLATPFLRAPRLSKIFDAELWVKYENLQATGSFKERGALNKLLLLTPEEKKR